MPATHAPRAPHCMDVRPEGQHAVVGGGLERDTRGGWPVGAPAVVADFLWQRPEPPQSWARHAREDPFLPGLTSRRHETGGMFDAYAENFDAVWATATLVREEG